MIEDPPRSRLERLDPDGEHARRFQGLSALTRRPWSSFLQLFGVSREALDQVGGLARQWARFAEVDETAASLAELGWPFFEMTPFDAATAAAELIRAGELEKADAMLVASWNDGGALPLRFSVHEVQKLYELPGLLRQPPGRRNIGHQRAVLIREAWDCHVAGQYAAAINLALAQVDGITQDFEQELFFSRQRNTTEPRADLTDKITLAGHPEALRATARMMTEPCKTTEVSGRLLRHGILHGRELGYGSLRNSTIALVVLRMVIVRMQLAADVIRAAEAQEWRAQVRGSIERDEFGHRLDTEGFAEAQSCLWYIGIWQRKHYEEHARYGDSLHDIAMGRPLYDKFGHGQTRCTDDGQRFWAWAAATTEAPYYFGLSCRDGERFDWRYADDRPPAGPVSTAAEYEPDAGGWYGVRDGPGDPDY